MSGAALNVSSFMKEVSGAKVPLTHEKCERQPTSVLENFISLFQRNKKIKEKF